MEMHDETDEEEQGTRHHEEQTGCTKKREREIINPDEKEFKQSIDERTNEQSRMHTLTFIILAEYLLSVVIEINENRMENANIVSIILTIRSNSSLRCCKIRCSLRISDNLFLRGS